MEKVYYDVNGNGVFLNKKTVDFALAGGITEEEVCSCLLEAEGIVDGVAKQITKEEYDKLPTSLSLYQKASDVDIKMMLEKYYMLFRNEGIELTGDQMYELLKQIGVIEN